MERFKFKTKGGISPQGIPRVFFCCHPKDFENVFDSVADEILAKQNCAVFYDSTPEAERDEQFYLDLSQMQLFVMPVTRRLLYSENAAISDLFPFAIEKHIPVLPLMQESGLEKEFNEKCGNLQFLDKNINDATAISYDEKLEKYLSSILIGDETAEKIRKEFDSYVFLSYRKKDRKYAQELMRLIHKNNFCRDVAIWYDEFLTPGENFNDAIRAAFDKSGLFVLAVTPNLVNEVNYVMTTEYPMAKNAGKPILPAELVPTDKTLLSVMYESIPACTDAHDEEALSAALYEKITKITKKENDYSPEHNFYIGLAYLGGVDVEVDHAKALELIAFAAENNVAEAVEKLVDMYRSGHGVSRNYFKAIEWQDKLIRIAQANYRADPSEENQNILVWRNIDRGDYYRELAKLDKAKENYIKAKSLLDCLDYEKLTDNQKRNYVACCHRIGDIFRLEKGFKDAKRYYEQSLEIALTLVVKEDNSEAESDLSISYNRLGSIYKAEGNLKGAKMLFEKALDIRIALTKQFRTAEAKRDLSISYNNLGNICEAEDDLEGARKYYEKVLEISLALAEDSRSAQSKRDLSAIYNSLGNVCKADGDFADAKEYYKKDLDISLELVEETGTVEDRRNLSISYNKLGNMCVVEKDIEGAREYYQKGLEIRLSLVAETGTFEAKRDLSVSYCNLGDICSREKDLYGARFYYKKCLGIRVVLADATGTVESKRDLLTVYNKLGNICEKEDDTKGAKEYYKKSLELSFVLARDTNMAEAKRNLSVSYNNLGDICATEEDYTSAKFYYKKALEIRLILAKHTDTLRAIKDLAVSYEKLGDICETEEDYDSAMEYYEKSFDIHLALVKETHTVESYEDLAVSYINLSSYYEDKEEEYLSKAIEILKMLVEKRPGVNRYRQYLKEAEEAYNEIKG